MLEKCDSIQNQWYILRLGNGTHCQSIVYTYTRKFQFSTALPLRAACYYLRSCLLCMSTLLTKFFFWFSINLLSLYKAAISRGRAENGWDGRALTPSTSRTSRGYDFKICPRTFYKESYLYGHYSLVHFKEDLQSLLEKDTTQYPICVYETPFKSLLVRHLGSTLFFQLICSDL